MKSDPAEYKEIIEKLLEKTKQHRVEWHVDLGGQFTTTVGGSKERTRMIALPDEPERFSFNIRLPRHDLSAPVLTMLDASDNVIFQAMSNDLPTSPDEEEISALLEQLYDLARRDALKVEQKIEIVSTILDRV